MPVSGSIRDIFSGLDPLLQGCRLMKPEYLTLSLIGAFLIVVILAWRKFHAVDRQFARMQQEINELRWMESRLFLMEVNAKGAADRADIVPQKGLVANDAGAGVKSTTLLPPANHSE
jgi:hypothetical protein